MVPKPYSRAVRIAAVIAFGAAILLAGLALRAWQPPADAPPKYEDARAIDTRALPLHLEELTWT